MLTTFSLSETASLSKQVSHIELWEVRCLRSCARFVCACALHLTHDVHHGLNGMCVKSCFIFQTRKARTVWRLAPLLPQLDPQQWVARLRASRLNEPRGFCELSESSAPTHDFCVSFL